MPVGCRRGDAPKFRGHEHIPVDKALAKEFVSESVDGAVGDLVALEIAEKRNQDGTVFVTGQGCDPGKP